MIERARALQDELIRLRRDIHSHPELGFQETRTAALVADTLTEIGGIRVQTGVGITGVVGELGDESGPTIAIRADMDALPIHEANDSGYRSQSDGVMHACGHDAHTAMLLGAAHLLRERFAAENLRGRVRFLFQPSEESWDKEGKSGAMRMIDDGALKNVDVVIALHVNSTAPVGTVATGSGWRSAAVDTFHGWITASGGHGAFPHKGIDPTFLMLPVLTAIHGIRARRLSPLEPGVISIGTLRSNSNAPNVIGSEVYLNGTIRTFDEDVRAQIPAELEQAFSIARTLGGDYRFELDRGYIAGWNDEKVNTWAEQVCTDLLGKEAINPDGKSMAGEDFAYMCREAPGVMIGLGAMLDDGVNRAHHTPFFDIDERCMPIGSAIVAETALRYLRGELK
ncbi:MAG: amidohydrolase [Oscillochloris sp.]|nr:amidohydrolase [Oscillochloris sp.]